jgi:UDP-N-acetylmuramate--alanine ligase
MKELTNIEGIYFLGIGGIGMSALARYFLAAGYCVCGYDRTGSPLTEALEEEGCHIVFDDNIDALPTLFADPAERDRVMVVYTPAIPKDSSILNYFKNNGYIIYKRAEVLGQVSRETDAIAVAGTHGKTTVSTMIAHILTVSQLKCSAFLGGISKNYNTNFLLNQSRYTVMEADEFDRSFLYLSPVIAVITAIDPDHLDIYGTAEAMIDAYSDFCGCVQKNGTLILHENILPALSLPGAVHVYSYGMGKNTSFRAADIEKGDGFYRFDLMTPGEPVKNIRLALPGLVNILNATAAAAAAWCAGAEPDEIRNALLTYEGVRRRFDTRFNNKGVVYIDDYAHHPQEINALSSAVRDFYPDRHITGIFQPHLFSRTRDFADGFAAALDRFDEILLLPIYPARENPIPGVTSEMIAAKMKNKHVRVVTREELLPILEDCGEGVLLTIGAGDIDRFIEPITTMLKRRYP